MTKLENGSTVGKMALKLATENLFQVPNCCLKHIHNWRKVYFNSIGIFKTTGIDWSKEYEE